MHDDAHRMFSEVNVMAPGYKKTESYLKNLHGSTQKQQGPIINQGTYSKSIIHPTPRELRARDSVITSTLDAFERTD